MGIDIKRSRLRISETSLHESMRSIETLNLHNKVAYFETLITLKCLKTRSQYLRKKISQFMCLRMSHGITKANYDSIMTSLIDLESLSKSL